MKQQGRLALQQSLMMRRTTPTLLRGASGLPLGTARNASSSSSSSLVRSNGSRAIFFARSSVPQPSSALARRGYAAPSGGGRGSSSTTSSSASSPASASFAAAKKGQGQQAPAQRGSGGGAGQQQAAAAAGGVAGVYEVHEATFMTQVIEASDKQIVLLDCYADWCAPCKQLAPLLTDAVRKSGGRLVLAKLNVDNNPRLAAQMQVSSLPTVIAVSGRSVVDSFVGLLQPAELNKFIERLLNEYGGASAEPEKEAFDFKGLIDEAETALAQGSVNEAAAKFAQAMEGDKELTHLAYAGLARCALEENNLQAAQHLIKELKDKFKNKLNDPAVGKAISAVELRAELASKGTNTQELTSQIGGWKQALEKNPDDHQTRYDLAQALFSTGQTEEAINHIFDLIKRDKYWNEEAARKLLLKIFSALGNDNEITIKARKRFASIWFC